MSELWDDDVDWRSDWQRWWAWRPVTTISGKRVWLSRCYRRRCVSTIRAKDGKPVFWTEYATLFDVMYYISN